MKRPLSTVALCAVLASHADAQPAPGLSPLVLPHIQQIFDSQETREGDLFTMRKKPGALCDGFELDLGIATWKPEANAQPGGQDQVALSDGTDLLNRWIAHERPAAGSMPVAIHEFISTTGVRGRLLWFDRPPDVNLSSVVHVTLGALPRGDGSLQTFRFISSGACTGRGRPIPIRCLESFDVVKTPEHGTREFQSVDAGYSILLPFDWCLGMGETCGNSYMMSDEARRHSFYPGNSFRTIDVSSSPSANIYTTFMAEPAKSLLNTAEDDKWSGTGTLDEFIFADGAKGFVKHVSQNDFSSNVYFRSLGTSIVRIMLYGGKDSDIDRVAAVVRSIRPIHPEPPALDGDGRAPYSFGWYGFTHKPDWVVAESQYAYMGSIRGDCTLVGPRRGNPKSEMEMMQVSLVFQVVRRSDLEAEDAVRRANKPGVDAAMASSKTTSESTDDTIRTIEGVLVRRVVGRMSIGARASDPKYAAAMKNLGYLPSVAVRYVLHTPDDVAALVCSAQLHGPESENDLAELDRVMTSVRFGQASLPTGSLPHPKMPDVVR